MNHLIWYFKQLFPFVYVSRYHEGDKPKLTIWRMWMGRCYNVRTYDLAE